MRAARAAAATGATQMASLRTFDPSLASLSAKVSASQFVEVQGASQALGAGDVVAVCMQQLTRLHKTRCIAPAIGWLAAIACAR